MPRAIPASKMYVMKAIAERQRDTSDRVPKCSATDHFLFIETHLVCKDQVHSHLVLEAVECPDGNELPNPNKNTQIQCESSCSFFTSTLYYNLTYTK